MKTLVLNQAYLPVTLFPLKTIRVEDAITRVLQGSATSLLEYESPIKTVKETNLFWPSVIVTNTPYMERVSLNNESLYYRDHCVCQYCDKPLFLSNMTRDHMKAKHLGGNDNWNNLVLSCQACNSRKGHKEAKGEWKPKRMPYEPKFNQILDIRKNFPLYVSDIRWSDFLPKWNSEIILRGG